MKVFLIVFALVLLVVIGSAGMMRYFDNKHAIKKDDSIKADDEKDV